VSNPVEDWLSNKAEIKEQPFRSPTRFVGPMIARLRSLWNSVSTKWYVRPLLQQQNEFNRLLVERLQDHDARLIEQDREQTALAHNLAEATAQLQQTNRLLRAIESRLQRLEETASAGDEETSGTS
jgi:uncharacterized coiled-coil protein SlyX